MDYQKQIQKRPGKSVDDRACDKKRFGTSKNQFC